MSEKRIKEEEEKLKINQMKLEEINEEIEYINKKIMRCNKRLEAINEDNLEEFIEYLNLLSSCYSDLSKNITAKICILKNNKYCKNTIEFWKVGTV